MSSTRFGGCCVCSHPPVAGTGKTVDAQKKWGGFIGMLDNLGTSPPFDYPVPSLITVKYLNFFATFSKSSLNNGGGDMRSTESATINVTWSKKFGDVNFIEVVDNYHGVTLFSYTLADDGSVTTTSDSSWDPSSPWYGDVQTYLDPGWQQLDNFPGGIVVSPGLPGDDPFLAWTDGFGDRYDGSVGNTSGSFSYHVGDTTGTGSYALTNPYDIAGAATDLLTLLGEVDLDDPIPIYTSDQVPGSGTTYGTFKFDYSNTLAGYPYTGFLGTTPAVWAKYVRSQLAVDGVTNMPISGGVALTPGQLLGPAGPYNPVAFIDYVCTALRDGLGDIYFAAPFLLARKSKWNLSNGFSGILIVNKVLQPFGPKNPGGFPTGTVGDPTCCTVIDGAVECGVATTRGAMEVDFLPPTVTLTGIDVVEKTPRSTDLGATTPDLFAWMLMMPLSTDKIGKSPDYVLYGPDDPFVGTYLPNYTETLYNTSPPGGCCTG